MRDPMGTRLAIFFVMLLGVTITMVRSFPGLKEEGCEFKCITRLLPFPVPEERPLPVVEGCDCTNVKRFLVSTGMKIRGTGNDHSQCPYAHKWAHLDVHDEL